LVFHYLDWGNHPGQDWIREQSSAGPYSPFKDVYFQAATQGKYADNHSLGPRHGCRQNQPSSALQMYCWLAAEAKAQLLAAILAYRM